MAAFYNQATLSYNGSVAVSNITTGEIIETLSATKEAVTDTYTTGSDTVLQSLKRRSAERTVRLELVHGSGLGHPYLIFILSQRQSLFLADDPF